MVDIKLYCINFIMNQVGLFLQNFVTIGGFIEIFFVIYSLIYNLKRRK